MLPSHLSCTRALLRPWRQEDRAALLRHINDAAVARNLRVVPHPYTEDDATAWLAFAAADPPPSGLWAIDVGGELVGTIGMEPGKDITSGAWEIGYWLGRAFWGRGIATEALRVVTAAAWAGEPGLHRIEAHVFAWNPASMRVLEKAGYRREAVLERSAIKEGTVIDRVVYALTRDIGLPYHPFHPVAGAVRA